MGEYFVQEYTDDAPYRSLDPPFEIGQRVRVVSTEKSRRHERICAIAEQLEVTPDYLMHKGEWEIIEEPQKTYWGPKSGWGVTVRLVLKPLYEDSFTVYLDTDWLKVI